MGRNGNPEQGGVLRERPVRKHNHWDTNATIASYWMYFINIKEVNGTAVSDMLLACNNKEDSLVQVVE